MNNKSFVLNNYKKPKRKTWKIILISIVVVLLGIGIWLGTSAYSAMKKITSLSGGSLFDVFSKSSQEIKGQSEGRTNILLLGMGGANHAGGTLSDTIMVVSIDWQTKKMAMISLPRDLWVKIPGNGSAKINAAYSYGEQNKNATGGGGEVSSKVVGEVLGIPVHYFVRIDFDGFKKIVDTLGGVDIVNEKDLYDSEYPAENMIDYAPFKLSAGPQHLNGDIALKYSRCRHGNCGDDFGRSGRQMEVIKAIKDKMMTLDILANPKKLTDLMGIIGDHLRTNLSAGEIKGLMDAQKGLDTQNIISKVLDTSADGPLTSPPQDGRGSIIVPKKGESNYTDLQSIAKNIFVQATTDSTKSPTEVQGATTSKTNYKIEVLNASNKSGVATIISNDLKKQGYTVSKVGDAKSNYSYSIVYGCGNASQTTAWEIAKNLKFRINYKTNCGGMDIQIVVGADYVTAH